MIDTTNKDKAERFSAGLGSLSNDGYPWRSDRSDALQRVFKSRFITAFDANPNEIYVVRDSITVYPNMQSRGSYFQRGTLVRVKSIEGGTGNAEVEVAGNIFQVTQGESIGNTPARFVNYAHTTNGVAFISEFRLVPMDDALRALEA